MARLGVVIVVQSVVGGQLLVMYPRDQYWVQSCVTSSLMNWMMVQCTLSRFAGDNKLGGVADTPEGLYCHKDRLIKNDSVCLMYQGTPVQRSPTEFYEILNTKNMSLKQMPI